MRAILLAATLGLGACAHTADPVTVCPPIAPYTPVQQAALAEAMADIADGSPIDIAMQDYERLRDAARACAAAKP